MANITYSRMHHTDTLPMYCTYAYSLVYECYVCLCRYCRNTLILLLVHMGISVDINKHINNFLGTYVCKYVCMEHIGENLTDCNLIPARLKLHYNEYFLHYDIITKITIALESHYNRITIKL